MTAFSLPSAVQSPIDNSSSLSDAPATSTANQRKRIMVEARRRGLDVDAVRDLAGGKLHDLSCRAASQLIQRLSGRGLPNAPGKKPRPYKQRRERQSRDREGAVFRMIQPDHTHQICRLMRDYFENDHYAQLWLRKNFKVAQPRELLTAERAGEVIAVLKRMLARRSVPSVPSVSSVVQSPIDNRQLAIANQPQGVAL